MPNPENVIGKGNRFSSTNQPANKGRKKSVFNQLRDKVYAEEGLRLSREDCYKLCASLIELPHTFPRLQDYVVAGQITTGPVHSQTPLPHLAGLLRALWVSFLVPIPCIPLF